MAWAGDVDIMADKKNFKNSCPLISLGFSLLGLEYLYNSLISIQFISLLYAVPTIALGGIRVISKASS